MNSQSAKREKMFENWNSLRKWGKAFINEATSLLHGHAPAPDHVNLRAICCASSVVYCLWEAGHGAEGFCRIVVLSAIADRIASADAPTEVHEPARKGCTDGATILTRERKGRPGILARVVQLNLQVVVSLQIMFVHQSEGIN